MVDKHHIYVETLVFEVTRECNMKCAHCIRGDAQSLKLKEDYVDKVLSEVDSIGTLIFSGGEPSLNIPMIEYIFQKCSDLGKMPSSFYVVTNGKANAIQLATTLLKWYAECDEPEYCGLALSSDDFHETAPKKEIRYFNGLSFFRPDDKMQKPGSRDWILDGGRAHENHLGRRAVSDNLDFCFEDIDEDDARIELMYVSANGKVCGECDLPYDCVDRFAPYTVDSFARAIANRISAEKEVA